MGVAVVALGTAAGPDAFPATPYEDKSQPVIFEVDAGKRFLPASNLKLYTAALALKVMGPEKTFATLVRTRNRPLDGTVSGGLFLVGGGDPSLGKDDLRDLARQVAARGIKRVTGSIIADGSAFRAESFGGHYPFGWILDDALWYYGPEISALAFNRNQIDVIVTGAAQPREAATIKVVPPLQGIALNSTVKTGAAGLAEKDSEELLQIERAQTGAPISNTITLSGHVAPGQVVSIGVALPEPERVAGLAFKQALQEAGVQVEGEVRGGAWPRDWPPGEETVIARHASPPLRVLLRRLLKNSDNLYAEMLLRAAALQANGKPESGTATRAHQLLLAWLRERGVPADSLRMTDGSGLSRYNLVTPLATARLLAAIEHLPGADALWDALPVAGVDGTLRQRMRDTAGAANVRAKTGTFSIVNTLSGYVTTRDGHRLAVSLLTNFARDGSLARRVQDQFYAALAAASWKETSAGN